MPTDASVSVAIGRPRRLPSRGAATTFGAGAGLFSVLAGRAVGRFGFGVAACRVGRATGACLAVLAGLYAGEGAAAMLVGDGATTAFGVVASAVGVVGLVCVVCVVPGASGVGVAVAVAVPAAGVARASSVVAFTGASAIRGDASLRGPDGGLSGIGT